jgi:EsV-1-7 cysteine-rich motif
MFRVAIKIVGVWQFACYHDGLAAYNALCTQHFITFIQSCCPSVCIRQPRFCKTHKEAHMVDVKNKKCEYNDCRKRASFGYKNDQVPLFCREHIGSGMVNVVSKRCEAIGCETTPIFGFEKDNHVRFCAQHKVPGTVDLKHKKCEMCRERAYYGDKNGGGPRYCRKHRPEGTVNLCKYAWRRARGS